MFRFLEFVGVVAGAGWENTFMKLRLNLLFTEIYVLLFNKKFDCFNYKFTKFLYQKLLITLTTFVQSVSIFYLLHPQVLTIFY